MMTSGKKIYELVRTVNVTVFFVMTIFEISKKNVNIYIYVINIVKEKYIIVRLKDKKKN